jgi:hypothetical protein
VKERQAIMDNEPNKKRCIEQILTAKKRISPETVKIVNGFFHKHSSKCIATVFEYLIGMLQGKGGEISDRIGVELYFKSFEGFTMAIEQFNYKEVHTKHANAVIDFATLSQNEAQEETCFEKELAKFYGPKEATKKAHFQNIFTLMYAHANFVKMAKFDEHEQKLIEKFEAEKDIAEKTIAQKQAIIESLNYKDQLEEQRRQLNRDLEHFESVKKDIAEQLPGLKKKFDSFEEQYFADL